MFGNRLHEFVVIRDFRFLDLPLSTLKGRHGLNMLKIFSASLRIDGLSWVVELA
jgi:hypothetical protein